MNGLGKLIGSVAILAGAAFGHGPETKEPPQPPQMTFDEMYQAGAAPMEVSRAEAGRLLKLVKSAGAQKFLVATNWAPFPEPREVYFKRETREARTPEQFAALDEAQRQGFEKLELTDKFYYNTLYGSHQAYARPLDLLALAAPDKDAFRPGVRVLDFGSGGVMQGRMLASLGCDVVGVDVDPLLEAFFRDPSDQGEIPGAAFAGENGPSGRLTLAWGRWPADEKVRARVGDRFDLILSKNTLKNGMVNPARDIPEKQRVSLGVANDEFVRHVASALRPGGLFLIYNIHPRQLPPEEGYIPWADGACPFPREMLERHGLEVVEFDKDDSAVIRQFGQALEWDRGAGAMNLEQDLFATYTLCRKPPTGKPEDAAQPAPKDEKGHPGHDHAGHGH